VAHENQPTDETDLPGNEAATAVVNPFLIASGRRLGGRYRLERALGHGGMAAVWLATDERLGRSVAVKVLSDTLAHDAEYLYRFRREARVAAGLQHPNLVPVYDFGAGERPYLVMEYIPGGDLAERVEAGDVPDVESLAEELLSALRHIHAAGVLHRDIKPQNVLIDAAGHARLTDFGIAQPRDATALTKTGQVIGTETYLAPEVKQGAPASERADLFALGVVLADLAREGAGAGVRELTERLRDPDPDRRPRSAAAALGTLAQRRSAPAGFSGTATQPFTPTDAAEAEADGPPATQPAAPAAAGAEADGPPAPRPFRPSPTRVQEARSRRTVVGLIALGLIGLALVIGLALGSDGGDDPSGVNVRERGEGSQNATAGGGPESGPATTPTPPPDGSATEPAEGAPAEEPVSNDGSATEPVEDSPAEEPATNDGAALNEEGFQLLQSGDPEAAVPVLEKAVNALEGSGGATYYYALYNLGDALVQAGRPDEAIPYLEQRLEFDDGQLGTVEAKLAEAREAAG
jgi:serine/threonine-protein kinase